MKTVCKNEVKPYVFRASKFYSSLDAPNSENVKNQYFYRLMVFTYGSATVVTDKSEEVCRKSDVLYLPPDTPYRILNTHGEFEVLNIYFDYGSSNSNSNGDSDSNSIEGDGAGDEYPYKTLFQSDFCKEYCREIYFFEDMPKLNNSFVIHGNTDIAVFAQKIFEEFMVNDNSSKRISSLLLLCITEELCRNGVSGQPDNKKYTELTDYIKEKCNEKITAAELSQKFHYHKNHINRIIKNTTGMNLKSFMLKTKIDAAEKLFEETNMSVTEIADYLNFFDASHFLKTYKKFGKDKNLYRMPENKH